jgi:hypothetical protein
VQGAANSARSGRAPPQQGAASSAPTRSLV